MRFLLFYSRNPRRQARLISKYRNWTITTRNVFKFLNCISLKARAILRESRLLLTRRTVEREKTFSL